MTGDNGWIAIDVGNSSIKFGRFAGGRSDTNDHASTLPTDVLRLAAADPDFVELGQWLGDDHRPAVVASVNRAALDHLIQWFSRHRPRQTVHVLRHDELPIDVDVLYPERVGHDRLAAALAASQLKPPGHAAIVVDAGSAVTVDLVSANGTFRGGAILPGWPSMAKALAEGTDALPQLPSLSLDSPPAVVGRSTEQAIASGLFWGCVGAIQELVARIDREVSTPCEVIVAGGDMSQIARHLGRAFRYEPELVLRGILIAARAKSW